MADGKGKTYPVDESNPEQAVEEPYDVNGVTHYPDGRVGVEAVELPNSWSVGYDSANDRLVLRDKKNDTEAYLNRNASGDILGGGSTDTDTHTDVSDDGVTIVSGVDDVNFGSLLSVTDDGDGTVTVAGSDETVRTRQANIPLTEIADTNTAVGLRKLVPSGKTLNILEIGVEDDTGAAPVGLTIEVRDLTNAVDIVSQNTRHNEGAPIASKAGAIDVAFRVANATGGPINASGYVLYTME